MSKIPEGLKYTKEHEWVLVEGDIAVFGITDHAQQELGEVVFVEVESEVGIEVEQEEEVGSLESVKAVSEVYSPISGEIIEINSAFEDTPELINEDPYGEGWLAKLRITNTSELDNLLSPEEYRQFIAE